MLFCFSCQVSYWSRFHVNIITGFWIVTIFICKGLARNLEIGNILVRVLPNTWRLGQVMNTKFGMNISNRMLLNAAKYHGYSFYCFWVIKGKPTKGVKLPAPLPPPTRLNTYKHQWPTKICKSFLDVTKLSHLEDRKTVHWKSHHDTGTTLSKSHLHCKSNLLRWSVTLGNFYTIRNFNYPLRL